MQIKKNLLVTFAVLMLGLTPVVATAPAFAATQTTNTTNHQNFFEGLIAFLAQKFGLDQNQVKSAVTEYRNQQKQQIQQNRQNREKTRLDTLVQQGKITSSQEQAILDELTKLRNEFNPSSLRNETPQQRRDALQKVRDEWTAWAKANNIDPNLIMPLFTGMRGGMMGGRGWHHGWITPTVTPQP